MNKLTQERLKELLHYNPETGVFTCLVRRARLDVGSVVGSRHNRGYVQLQLDGKKYLAHRLAWLYTHGQWPQLEIDHIDRNRANNRIANLRDVSSTTNNFNTCTPRNNTSGVKGVRWFAPARRWQARIGLNGREICLGYFRHFEDAAAARRTAEQKVA